MSGTTGGSTPQDGLDILALGVDSSGVDRGVQQAKASLGQLEGAADKAASAWDGLLGALGDTAMRGQQAAPAIGGVGQSAESTTERTRRLAQSLWDNARAMAEARQIALSTQQSLTTYMAAAHGASRAQQELNERLGVRATTAEDYRARARDIEAYGIELDRLRAKFNPLYAAGQEYRRGLEELRRAQAVGAISAAEAAAAQDRLKAATQANVNAMRGIAPAGREAAEGVKLTSFQLTNLSYQIQDAAVQLSMGQNPLMILMQQGPQAAMAVGGLGAAFSRMLGAITPVNAAIGVATVTLGGWLVMMNQVSSRMADLRSSLRATRDDYIEMSRTVSEVARAVGGTSGIGTSDARQAAAAIVGARGFAGSTQDIERITRLSADLARVLGQDVPQAAGAMAKALADPAAVARDLAQSGMFGFTDALRRNVEQLVAQGDKANAARLVLEQYGRRIQGAADDVTPLTRAWRSVAGAIDAATDALNRFLERQEERSRRWSNRLFDDPTSSRVDGGGLYRPPGERFTAPGGTLVTPELAVLQRRDATSREIEAAVRAQAQAMGLDPTFAARIAQRESTFRQYNPDGSIYTSPRGARGIMQVMPRTGEEVQPGVNLDDPIQNVITGLRYLQQMLSGVRGDQSLAAAAYNAGPERLRQFLEGGRPLPDETLRYVRGLPGALSGGAATMERADSAISGQDYRSDRLRVLGGTRDALNAILAAPEIDQNGEAARRYREALEKVRAEIEALEKPTDRMARQQQMAAELYRTGAGAARELAQAEQQAAEQAKAAGASAAEQAIAGMTAREAKQRELLGQLTDYMEQQGRSVEATQAEAAAMLEGAAAAGQIADQRRAEADALKYAAPETRAYQDAVQRLTELYGQQRAAAADLATARQGLQSRQQIELLQAEIALVGQSVTVREREIAALKVRQDIVARGGNPDSDVSTRAIQQARDTATLRGELDRTQAAYNDLASVGEQAFSRIGQAITTALANGQAGTIRFGNIVKGVFSEVLQYLARISVMNPLQNAVFGRNLPTIGDAGGIIGRLFGGGGASGLGVGGAAGGGMWGSAGLSNTSLSLGGLTILGGAGGSAAMPAAARGSGGGILDTLSSGSSILSFGSRAWDFLSGGAQGLANSLNPGTWGITNSLGLGGVFNAPLWGGAGVSQAAWTPLSGGAIGPVATAGDFGAATLGGLMGSFGLGMGAGSLASMVVGGIRGTAEPWGGLGGAALGAGIGAIFGPVGALVGGLLGGAGGAMFGPTKKGMAQRAGGTVSIGVSEGGLVITGAGGKRWDEAGARAEIQEELDRLNQGFQSRGFYFDGYSSRIGFGQGAERAGEQMAFDPFSVRGALRSANPNLQTILRTTQATSIEGLFSDADFVTQQYEPSIQKARDATDSFTASVRRLDQEYGPIADRARALGLATQDLVDAWFKQRGRLIQERDLTVMGIETNLDARLARLNGQGERADSLAFEQQVREEAFNLRNRLEDLGQAAWQVTATMSKLAEVQAREREAIVKARQEQAAGAVSGVVLNMADYARSLRTSAASPLSAQAQFSMASADFDRIVSGIEGGKWSDTSRLTGYADALLGNARNLYGSGTAYVDVFNRVLAALERVAAAPAEELTAQVLREETRTQTDVMKRALEDLKAEVIALRREVAVSAATPTRLVA